MQDPIDLLGGTTAVARLCGVTPAAACHWRTRGIPLERCVSIERSNSLGVRRWDLRPLDWHLIWPELIGTEGAPAVPANDHQAEVRDVA